MLASQAFDVVVSNSNMPVPSGLEFLSRIRRDYGDMILVLTTAYGTDALEEGVRKLGVGYITKPFGPSVLVQVIKGLLQGQETTGNTENPSRITDEPGKIAGSAGGMRLGDTSRMNLKTTRKEFFAWPIQQRLRWAWMTNCPSDEAIAFFNGHYYDS